jgi:hypothetical protein
MEIELETVVLSAEDERELWEGYEAYLNERADIYDYESAWM